MTLTPREKIASLTSSLLVGRQCVPTSVAGA